MKTLCLLILMMFLWHAALLKGNTQPSETLHFKSSHSYNGEICSIEISSNGSLVSHFANHYRETKEYSEISLEPQVVQRIISSAKTIENFSLGCASGDGNDVDMYLSVFSEGIERHSHACRGAYAWPKDRETIKLVSLIQDVLPISYRNACFKF